MDDYGNLTGHAEFVINGTEDKLVVENFGYDTGSENCRIERVQFADGTAWDLEIILGKLNSIVGTEYGDYIQAPFSGMTIEGRGGDDVLLGTDGDDVLDGGEGDDYIEGYGGSDTYVFGRGYGVDSIETWNFERTSKVKLLDGILPEDVIIRRCFDDYGYETGKAEIRIVGSDDKLIYNYSSDGSLIGEIEFADGTVWGADDIQTAIRNIEGTDGDDILYGFEPEQVFDGKEGNDYMESQTGGNDTYVFGTGYGVDTIYDLGHYGTDTVKFKDGITQEDLIFRVRMEDYGSISNDLEILIRGTEDKLIIKEFFTMGGMTISFTEIENFEFADGTVLGADDVKAMIVYEGTEGDDYIYAHYDDATTMRGCGGNDNMTGSGGDDVMDGGEGNDIMYGGAGNDTYIFGLGYGSDTIYEYGQEGDVDTIKFLEGIMADDLTLSVCYDDYWTECLEIIVNSTGDRLLVANQSIGTGENSIERFEFADGTVWESADIESSIASTQSAAMLIQDMSSFGADEGMMQTVSESINTGENNIVDISASNPDSLGMTA